MAAEDKRKVFVNAVAPEVLTGPGGLIRVTF